jgi:hypothetical protein
MKKLVFCLLLTMVYMLVYLIALQQLKSNFFSKIKATDEALELLVQVELATGMIINYSTYFYF